MERSHVDYISLWRNELTVEQIKCDAISEAAGAQCSGCRRSDAPCMFSRTPQKRGPSKG